MVRSPTVPMLEELVDMFVEFVEISDVLAAMSVSLELIFEVFVEILDVLVLISDSTSEIVPRRKISSASRI